MLVNPNSTIYLYSGVPLDNTYQDTLYFATRADQNTYFSGLTPVKTFTYNMYQRVNSGVFRAQCVADEIYNVNYMRFQNTAYGNKWFYAFVTKVEYDNNGMSLVEYEIDSIQTYLLDCTLKQCFIERQHSATDQIGDNILPEPVNCGEYIYSDYGVINSDLTDYAVLVGICDVNGATHGQMYDGVYGGVTLYAYPNTPAASVTINNFISSYAQRPESVVIIYMVPKFVLGTGASQLSDDYGLTLASSRKGASTTGRLLSINSSQDFESYTPRNKKLLTYPYNYLQVDNGNGSSIALRYEFMEHPDAPACLFESCITNPVQVKLVPLQYKGGGTDINPLLTEFLTIDGYPLCSWNYDAYRAWCAQNSIPVAISAGGIVAGMALGFAIGGPVGLATAGLAGVTGAANLAKQQYTASIQADNCIGNVSSGNVNFANKQMNFYQGRCHITRDYARMIDKFFDKYGYAFNKIATPALHVRERWTYIKTNECKLIGNCPSNEIKNICEKFNNGITFWTSADVVGNYALQNRCLSEI